MLVKLAQLRPVGNVWLESALAIQRCLLLDVSVVPLLLNLLFPLLASFYKVLLPLPADRARARFLRRAFPRGKPLLFLARLLSIRVESASVLLLSLSEVPPRVVCLLSLLFFLAVEEEFVPNWKT